MIIKRVLRPERLRHVPPQFSWVDQRLVRDGYLGHCDAAALALYLLLVTVADAQGLSYYGDAAICRLLSLQQGQLEQARRDLIGIGLLAYQRPLYQVLALDRQPPPPAREPGVQPLQRGLRRVRAQLERSRRPVQNYNAPHLART